MHPPPSEAEQDLIDLWKKRTGETMNQDDAKAATENLVGFFKTLADWDSKDKLKDKQEEPKNLP